MQRHTTTNIEGQRHTPTIKEGQRQKTTDKSNDKDKYKDKQKIHLIFFRLLEYMAVCLPAG